MEFLLIENFLCLRSGNLLVPSYSIAKYYITIFFFFFPVDGKLVFLVIIWQYYLTICTIPQYDPD